MSELTTTTEQAQKQDAIKKANEGVTVPDTTIDRQAFIKLDAEHQDVFTKYGETSLTGFLTKIGSDGIFAQKVVLDLLSGGKGEGIGLSPDSPQENNITGKLDHTGDVATRAKFEGQTNVPAPTAKKVA